MPLKPYHGCSYPNCPALIRDGSYCPDHKRQRQKQYDTQRGSSAARGYGAAWQKIRAAILRAEPLCRRCRTDNITRAAAHVHHINGNQHDNRADNLEPLCEQHHTQHTGREQGWGRKR